MLVESLNSEMPKSAEMEQALDGVLQSLLTPRRASEMWLNRPFFSEEALNYLIDHARNLIANEPMLVEVAAPINVCGDIHGQLHDLQVLLDVGPPPTNRFLFLGDYVDRGKFGIECISVLLRLKMKYPDKVYLLRGNHESSAIARQYGFFDECKRRYKNGLKLFKKFTDLFSYLPIAAVIEGRALCMHGGISSELQSLDQIRNLARPYEVPESGLVADILWSDPSEDHLGWQPSERGVSFTFGRDILDDFTRKMDLDLIIRAHQVMDNGYGFFAGRKLVTVFSASNYCGEFTNLGAMLLMDGDLRCKFNIFKPDYNAAAASLNA